MTETSRTSERLLWALQERAKELSCLYEVEESLSRTEATREEVFEGIIRAIPPGWQYPEICQAEIEYEGKAFRSPEFAETPWVQSADIVVQDRVVGRVAVSYTQEMPQADDGPFLKEESKLIRTIADRVGHFLLHQELRSLVHEWRDAHVALEDQTSTEWRVAVNLLRRTDQALFVRIARKMANFLSWTGVAEAAALLQGFGGGRPDASSELLAEKNVPSERLRLDDPMVLADRVFEVAGRYVSDQEMLARIYKWIHEERSSFLVRAVVSSTATASEIADAIRRYLHLMPAGTGLSPETLNTVKAALIRRFLSEEPSYVGVAKSYLELEDVLSLLEHLICMPNSPGRLGGKAAGVFLASQILQKAAEESSTAPSFRVPTTWYIATDSIHAFVRYNNLEEVYEQKYKQTDQVRLEYPNLVQLFKHSQFPAEIVSGLSVALDQLHDGPLIVRSSSLLEDRLGAAFSGKYRSLFLANRGSKSQRLAALLDAVAEVYASVFGPDPLQYRAERGLLDLREEMGIMIQEVVGTQVGHYYCPAFAGVAVSNNEFRWSPRIKRSDGLVRMVPGLGTRAVDRVRDDYPILVAPGQPGLRVNVTTDEAVRYAPRYADVIDLETQRLETVSMREVLREVGPAWPAAMRMLSVREGDRLARPSGVLVDWDHDDLVVTFEGLIADTTFVQTMGAILRVLQERLGHPVELEFASDGAELYLLQCRPQTGALGAVGSTIPKDVPGDRLLFTANRYVSNGQVADITHVVYVDPDGYIELSRGEDLLAVGRAVSRLNAVLPKRQFILMGPGRWGSRGDIKLGVQVTYSDINNAAMLVEIARQRGNYLPDLSFGTHFFQDLVEASIRYLPLYPDDDGVVFNERFFTDTRNELASLAPEYASLADVVRVIDVPQASGGYVLRVLMNAGQDRAVGMLGLPGQGGEATTDEEAQVPREPAEDHWRWRMRMAERIAAQLDPGRFGVAAMYVIGSTKNATAGPSSDIDLIVHVRGDREERKQLDLWLDGWSRCLDEMNYLRTGFRGDGLLDVHVLTDDDIAARSSYAVKIGAVTDAALELPLGKGGG